MLRVVLVHPGPVILPELNEQLGAYAQRRLVGRKIEIRLNTKVEGFFIIAMVRGTKKKTLRFSTIGQLAAIGRRTGVANGSGARFRG